MLVSLLVFYHSKRKGTNTGYKCGEQFLEDSEPENGGDHRIGRVTQVRCSVAGSGVSLAWLIDM